MVGTAVRFAQGAVTHPGLVMTSRRGRMSKTAEQSARRKAKAKAKAPKPTKPTPVTGVLLQRALAQAFAFHSRRISDAIECGAGDVDFFASCASATANAFERALLDAMLNDRSSAPLEHIVDVLTGFPKVRK